MDKNDKVTKIRAALDKYPVVPVALGGLAGGTVGLGMGALYGITDPHMAPAYLAGGVLGGGLSGMGAGFHLSRTQQRQALRRALKKQQRESTQKEASAPLRYALAGGAMGAGLGGFTGLLDVIQDMGDQNRQKITSAHDKKNRLKHIGIKAGVGAAGGALTGGLLHYGLAAEDAEHAAREARRAAYERHARNAHDAWWSDFQRRTQDAHRKAQEQRAGYEQRARAAHEEYRKAQSAYEQSARSGQRTRDAYEEYRKAYGGGTNWDDLFKNLRGAAHTPHAEALGIDPSKVTTKKEAREAYIRAVKAVHPDRAGGDPAKATKVNNAWRDLQNTSWYAGLKTASYTPLYAFLRECGML